MEHMRSVDTFFNIYKDNPTAGAKDGTPVSKDGTFTAPITFVIGANNEVEPIKLAVRAEEGYVLKSPIAYITRNGDTDSWGLIQGGFGGGAGSDDDTEIYDRNYIFYLYWEGTYEQLLAADLTEYQLCFDCFCEREVPLYNT